MAIFILLTLLLITSDTLGAESLPPNDRRMLESHTLNSGKHDTDSASRNETLNEVRAAPTTPPPSHTAPATPPGPAARTTALPPLPVKTP